MLITLRSLNTRHRIRKIAGGDEVYSMNVSLQQSGRPELSTMAFEGKSGHSSTNVASVVSIYNYTLLGFARLTVT